MHFPTSKSYRFLQYLQLNLNLIKLRYFHFLFCFCLSDLYYILQSNKSWQRNIVLKNCTHVFETVCITFATDFTTFVCLKFSKLDEQNWKVWSMARYKWERCKHTNVEERQFDIGLRILLVSGNTVSNTL